MPAKIEFDVDSMIDRYKAGETAPMLARAFGVSEGTIYHRLKAAGVQRRKSGPPPKYDDAKICQMYREGADIQEIKRKTGAHNIATFYAILKRNNVPLRLQRHKRDDPEVKARISALRDKGWTLQAIADEIGINRTYVGEVLRQEIPEVNLNRKRWQADITLHRGMSIQEMRDTGATINEIADIKQISPVDVFKHLQENS